jgi:hypothetical protein
MRLSLIAEEAAPTGANERNDYKVAWFGERDTEAYLGHDPGRFMPIDSRQRTAPSPIHVENVTMADGAGRELDAHFIRLRWIENNVFNQQGLPKFIANGCFHGTKSPPEW